MTLICHFSATVLAAAFLLPHFAGASDDTAVYGSVYISSIRSVYDGDTFRADIAGWPPLIGQNIPVRVDGVDTPEIKGQCPREIGLARQAREAALALIVSAAQIELRNIRRGKYFRIVAEVWIDGRNLADELIRRGLGRPYNGGSRSGWC